MVKTNLFNSTDVHSVSMERGCFSVIEYSRDVSVNEENAMEAYFASKMLVKKKQLVAKLDGKNGVVIQAGAMQLMMGNVKAKADISGAGDLLKKMVGSTVTGETAIKPKYEGDGLLVLEPTYKHILLENLSDWGGGMIIDDGMFLACESSVDMKVTSRRNLSSAVLGGEGLFNTMFTGDGVVALESNVPRDELIVVELTDDTLKIDGNMAVAWSKGLNFTVEKATNTLIGSAASGEGFVNVYRGTGRVMLSPVDRMKYVNQIKKNG